MHYYNTLLMNHLCVSPQPGTRCTDTRLELTSKCDGGDKDHHVNVNKTLQHVKL